MSADLPVVLPIAELIASPPPACPIELPRCLSILLAEPLPQEDVITMALILHDWNLDKKMHMIKAAYQAVRPGGAFVVVDNLIDDARRENAFGLMMSLNMLIEFGDAFDYSGHDFSEWCRSAGFKRTEIIPLGGPASAGIAYK